MNVAFAPLSLGSILAMLAIMITIILMLPMINMVPVPIGLLIIAIAAARLT